MPGNTKPVESPSVNRRRVLKGLGAVTTTGIAGCQSSDDTETPGDGNGNGGGQELGERVPNVSIAYWSDMGGEYTGPWEAAGPVLVENLSEIGVTAELQPKTFQAEIDAITQNTREFEMCFFGHSFIGRRLDPSEFVNDYTAEKAIAGGNWCEYMNCEFTDIAKQQVAEGNRDERQELINRAQELFTSEAANCTISNKVLYSAFNERIELGGFGDLGLSGNILWHVLGSEVKEGPNVIRNNQQPASLERVLNPTIDNQNEIPSRMIGSTLLWFNQDLEHEGMLARSWETSSDETTVTVELEDAQFHNGDPITARDVAWTFNFIFDNPEVYYWQLSGIPWAEEPQLEEPWGFVDVIDDKTVAFNLESPFAPLTTFTFTEWGILHADSWSEQGAPSNPREFSPDPFIGSGPLVPVHHESRRTLEMEPSPVEHPVWNPDHNVVFTAFQDAAGAFQALEAGEMDILMDTSFSFYEQAENTDGLAGAATETLGAQTVYPQAAHGPAKFLAFRKALRAVPNRDKMIQLMYRGEAEPQFAGSLYLKTTSGNTHPWRPPEERLSKDTENPQGDPEKARQILEDAGWGWDDNGNLHYPPDADLSPVFPQDVENSDGSWADEFACLAGDGSYIPPNER